MHLIDKTSHVPMYIQIKEKILEEIRSGAMKPDQQMLSEPKMAELYGVNRLTARSAVTELVNEGYLSRIHGVGTFVRRPRIETSSSYFASFIDEMRSKGYSVETTVLERKIIAAPRMVRESLALGGPDVYYIRRRRSVNNEMIVVLESFLPTTLCRGLLEQDLVARSLYEILRTEYDLIPDHAQERMEARIADETIAAELGLTVGSPILFAWRQAFLSTGEPFEYNNCWYRGDRYAFDVSLKLRSNET